MREAGLEFKSVEFEQKRTNSYIRFRTSGYEYEYEFLRKMHYSGFALVYLSQRSYDYLSQRFNPNDVIDKEVYSKLVELDTRLGTTASEQLFWCLKKTTRSDIIKVERFLRMKDSLSF